MPLRFVSLRSRIWFSRKHTILRINIHKAEKAGLSERPAFLCRSGLPFARIIHLQFEGERGERGRTGKTDRFLEISFREGLLQIFWFSMADGRDMLLT